MIAIFVVLIQVFRRARLILQSQELRGLFMIVLVLLLVGAVFYHNVEKWSLLDSLYFSVITLTTIGYGDFTPHTPLGKVFTMVYVFMGLGALGVFISAVSEQTLNENRRRVREKLETSGDTAEVKDAEKQE
jgi:voltage-gated potassium channel Kch